MKGMIFGLPFILVIFSFLIVIIFTTVIVFRYRVSVEVQFEYGYDNTQLTLLTLLSSTYNNKPVSELIGEYISINQPNENDLNNILKERLDKMTIDEQRFKCYKFGTSSKTLVWTPIGGCAPIHTANAKIVLPYNPGKLSENIILVTE